jgi:Xaa-Pro aminopeptidase
VFYHHGDREIQSGDPVLLDFGCVVDHYCSDQTRIVVFDGDPPQEFPRVHEAVLEAHEAAVEAVEPVVPAEAVEETAHSILEEYGYLDSTQHRTGHGVGLTVHEGPNILKGNDQPLEPGMVFSVEPGVYFEDRFGVRIEDLVAVTETGYRRLNDSPRTWRPL